MKNCRNLQQNEREKLQTAKTLKFVASLQVPRECYKSCCASVSCGFEVIEFFYLALWTYREIYIFGWRRETKYQPFIVGDAFLPLIIFSALKCGDIVGMSFNLITIKMPFFPLAASLPPVH